MCFAQGLGPAGDAKDVCVSCPRQLGLGNRRIERILGGSDQLCVLSNGPHPSLDSTDDHLQVQNHHDCTRVARDVLILGEFDLNLVNLSTKLLLKLSFWVNLLTQPFSDRLHNNLAYLNLHVWPQESVMNIQEGS